MSPKQNDISQEELERIEVYLDNSMSETDKEVFEKHLQLDDAFKQKVEEVKLLTQAIETQSLKEKLDEFHTGIEGKPVKDISQSRLKSFSKYAMAASIVVLIGIGGFWLGNGNSNQKLYDKYFKPDPGLPTIMSVDNNFQFYDAMVNYKKAEYSMAIEKWTELHDKKPGNDTLNYFIGVSHLANNDAEEAISYLESVTETPESVFRNEAYYYLGLAYLRNDNVELAKKNLNFSATDYSKNLLSELAE